MKKFLALLIVLAISLFGVSAAFAAYDMKIDEDTYVKFGFKSQIWVQKAEDGAPNTTNAAVSLTANLTDGGQGGSDSTDVSIKQARIYVSGQITNVVKFGMNYDFGRGIRDAGTTKWGLNGGGNFATLGSGNTNVGGAPSSSGVTDGFITLDLMPEVKVMTGIYRMAVSRIALEDSYAYLLPHGPAVGGANTLSNLNNYRNAGVTLWGDVAGGMIRYNVAAWDGSYTPFGTGGLDFSTDPATRLLTVQDANPNDKMAKSARLVINLLEPEKGYTNAGTYLGKAKNIASIGAGYMSQKYHDGALDNATSAFVWDGIDREYSMMTVDAFVEMAGLTAEAAYFKYDMDSATGLTPNQKPKEWYVQVAYLIGNIQPAVRFEKLDSDTLGAIGVPGTDFKRTVAGVNYYLDGQNAKISLEYLKHKWGTTLDPVAGGIPRLTTNYTDWTLALQVQF